jgi:hypothetical protein
MANKRSRRGQRPTASGEKTVANPGFWQTPWVKVAAFTGALLAAFGAAAVSPVGEHLGTTVVEWMSDDPPAPAACGHDGPPITVQLKEHYAGGGWWMATERPIPASLLATLNVNNPDLKIENELDRPVKMSTGGSLHRLILVGQCSRPVLIDDIYTIVTSRSAPLSGGVLVQPSQGDLEAQAAVADLDAPTKTQLLKYDVQKEQRGGPFFSGKITELKDGEAYPIDVFGQSAKQTVEWRIGIDAHVGDEKFTIEASLPSGQPIRTTSKAKDYSSAMVFSTETFTWEAVDGKDFWNRG